MNSSQHTLYSISKEEHSAISNIKNISKNVWVASQNCFRNNIGHEITFYKTAFQK